MGQPQTTYILSFQDESTGPHKISKSQRRAIRSQAARAAYDQRACRAIQNHRKKRRNEEFFAVQQAPSTLETEQCAWETNSFAPARDSDMPLEHVKSSIPRLYSSPMRLTDALGLDPAALPFAPSMMDHYLQELAGPIPELDLHPDAFVLRRLWFPMALAHPSLLHIILLTSSSHYLAHANTATTIPGGAASTLLALKSVCLQHINSLLAGLSTPPVSAAKNSNDLSSREALSSSYISKSTSRSDSNSRSYEFSSTAQSMSTTPPSLYEDSSSAAAEHLWLNSHPFVPQDPLFGGTFHNAPSQPSDALIAGVAKLAAYEAMYGSATAFASHMRGLRHLVSLRGGLSCLGVEGLLARMIIWIDRNGTFVVGEAGSADWDQGERPSCWFTEADVGDTDITGFLGAW